jgi:hypothetical protein
MKPGNLPQGNKRKPANVSSLVINDKPNTVNMRTGNINKEGQMDKPFKG